MDDHADGTLPTSDNSISASTPSDAPSEGPRPLVEVGPTPPDRVIRFELVLAFPGRKAMQAYAVSVGDPTSPDYRRFLEAEEIGARFGLADADLERVAAWATEHGVSVVATSPQRIALAVDASAGAIEAHFGVSLRDYADPAGRTFTAPIAEASVLPELEGLVASIAGLDARPTERPALTYPIAAGPQGGMTPPIIDRERTSTT